MGQAQAIDGSVAAEAAAVLGRAHRELIGVLDGDEGGDGCDVLERAADRLGALGRLGGCSARLGRSLLDWRDHLSSHVLAARALQDIGVHGDAATHLLERGLADVAGQLAALRGDTAPAFR